MSDTDTTPPAAAPEPREQTYKLERRDPPTGYRPTSFHADDIGSALEESLEALGPIGEHEIGWEADHLLITTANDEAWSITPCDLITELSTVDGWSVELIAAYLTEAHEEHGLEGIDTASREEFAQWLAARANAAIAQASSADPVAAGWLAQLNSAAARTNPASGWDEPIAVTPRAVLAALDEAQARIAVAEEQIAAQRQQLEAARLGEIERDEEFNAIGRVLDACGVPRTAEGGQVLDTIARVRMAARSSRPTPAIPEPVLGPEPTAPRGPARR